MKGSIRQRSPRLMGAHHRHGPGRPRRWETRRGVQRPANGVTGARVRWPSTSAAHVAGLALDAGAAKPRAKGITAHRADSENRSTGRTGDVFSPVEAAGRGFAKLPGLGKGVPAPRPGNPAAASHNRYHADASVGGFGSFTCPQPGQAITRPLSTSRPHTRIDGGGVLDRHRGRSCPGARPGGQPPL